jgi:hypothetical protein
VTLTAHHSYAKAISRLSFLMTPASAVTYEALKSNAITTRRTKLMSKYNEMKSRPRDSK